MIEERAQHKSEDDVMREEPQTTEPTTATDEMSASVPELSADEQLQQQAAEWRDKFLRKLAEFENFRKRTRSELEQSREAALDAVLAGLLPVLDDFDRLLSGNWDAEDSHRKGIELIRAKLWNYFAARGVERMEALGKVFDAAEHEALAMQPTADFPPHTVMAVVAPGYRRGERVIRHAQVIVSSELQDTGPENSGDNVQ